MNATQELANFKALQDLLKQIVEIICYQPGVPQEAKTELLNRAARYGINFRHDQCTR